jgi:hypothetical protein
VREIRLTGEDLAVAKGRRDRAGADLLAARADLSELRNSTPLGTILRGSQEKCGTLERELDWLREEQERKRPKWGVLRNESAPSRRELAKETETNRALGAQVARLQILRCPCVVQVQEVPLQREQVQPLAAYERNMGVSPDSEERKRKRKRKRHRKRGDALFRALPAMAEDLPVGQILSLVLTAMLRGRVPRSAPFLESRAGLGFWLMLVHAGGVPCLIADLVVLSRDRRPARSTLRNMQFDAPGGLGQVEQWATARQVAAVDAPTAPSTGQARAPGDGTQLPFTFDSEPPVW